MTADEQLQVIISKLTTVSIDMLSEIDGLSDDDEALSDVIDSTTFAVQYYLKAYSDVKGAISTLKLAKLYMARELAGNM